MEKTYEVADYETSEEIEFLREELKKVTNGKAIDVIVAAMVSLLAVIVNWYGDNYQSKFDPLQSTKDMLDFYVNEYKINRKEKAH